ncbi:ribbon-helix-helix protein, CopG family [Iamia sp.]|uniref:ribbon-helix-helix protein, CopG family n=1 Tax=Iamia sp. TaxID=2722710 RepID=UPI002CFEC039|nr:ribbon-helix-helix protein, CopG family [Iamia sp.]HXH56844.1 ribbon-helix-helix protein, CopG family [Iamia sp.]
MRTTITLDDDLYREVKVQAARDGRTVGQIIEDALRARPGEAAEAAAIEPLPVYGGSGVLPGVDLGDNAALRDRMDAGESLDALR